MEIKNIEGLSGAQIRQAVSNGAKFVIYSYCISLILITFKRHSSIYFIESGKSSVTPGLKYLLLTFFLGWWGIPWGPIYTIGAIIGILGGGKNVTAEIMSEINQNDPNYGTSGYGLGLSNNNGADETPTYNL